jgi:hypothetical protein
MPQPTTQPAKSAKFEQILRLGLGVAMLLAVIGWQILTGLPQIS